MESNVAMSMNEVLDTGTFDEMNELFGYCLDNNKEIDVGEYFKHLKEKEENNLN